MSISTEPYRRRNRSSQRSASLPRRTRLRKRHHFIDLSPYRHVFPAVDTLSSSLQSYTLSTRKPSAIDPELRDAKKLGSHYHITMNLSALVDHPVNITSEDAATSADYITLRSSSPSVSDFDLAQGRATAINGHRMNVIRMSTGDQEVNGHYKVSPLTARRSRLNDDGYVIQSVRASSSSVNRPSSVQRQDESFIIRSVTPSTRVGAPTEAKEDDKVSFDLQLIGLDASNSRSKVMQQTSYIVKAETQNSRRTTLHKKTEERQTPSDVEPMYTMTIDETMTMDYYQPEESTKSADTTDSVTKQAKSKMPRPSHSQSKGRTYDEEETRRVVQQQLPSSSAAASNAAPRATHRKRPKHATKDTEEPNAAARRAGPPSSGAYRSMTVDNSLYGEQLKQTRIVGDKSDEEFVVADETGKAQNSQRLRHDLTGQKLTTSSSQRRNAAVDEPDGATAPYRDQSLSSRTPVQYEALIPTGIRRETGKIEGRSVEELHTGRGGTTGRIKGDSDDEFFREIHISQGLHDQPKSFSSTLSSSIARQLMKDAPEGSIRQRVNIERQEEEVAGPLEDKATSYASSDHTSPHNLLNADLVSEKVDMKVEDGVAKLVVKVTSETLVPIHGSADLYKKSSISVSRFIDVDLTVTEERRRIYDNIMKNCLPSGKLSNRDTFELYIAFMELAELHPSAEWDQQQLWIDKKVDEERLAKYTPLENRLGDTDGLTRYGVQSNIIASEKVRQMRSPNPGFTQMSTSYCAREY